MAAISPQTTPSTIDIFVFRSGARINFESPKTLLVSTVKTYLHKYWQKLVPKFWGGYSPRPIGHVAIRYQCGCDAWPKGLARERLTGQIGNLQQQGLKLAIQRAGLASMLSVYTDGVLESESDLLADLKDYSRIPGALRILTLKTSCEICRKTADFITKWESSGASQNYTLTLLPEAFDPKREFPPDFAQSRSAGGGCGSFVLGTLMHAQVLGDHSRTFRDSVSIPLRANLEWAHWPELPPPFTQMRPEWLTVASKTPPRSIWEFLVSPESESWGAKKPENEAKIEAVEPELFYDWITGAANSVRKWRSEPELPSRTEAQIRWFSSGSFDRAMASLRAQQARGAQWVQPFEGRDHAHIRTFPEAPYFGTPTLEVDLNP